MKPSIAIVSLLVCALAWPLTASSGDAYAVHESESSFEDVMEGAKMAIEERGMYINNVMHMGEMLERTGKDLGLGDKLYEHAESIEFCSAILSRKMITENPARIVNCPFIPSIYNLPGETDKTYVAYRRIPASEIEGSAVMKEVADMLEGIAGAAVDW